MNREFLKDQGLTDEQIEKVMASHGKTVNSIKEKADSAEGLESQIDDYKEQIADRDTQLNNLSEQVKDNKELTNQIDDLKAANQTATEELQTKLDQQSFDFSLERELTSAKARNPKAVKALLDTESIKLDGEKLLGLDDQIKALQESDPYLFESEEDESGGNPNFTSGNHQRKTGVNPFSKDNFNLTEQSRLFKEDPAKYKQFKAEAK